MFEADGEKAHRKRLAEQKAEQAERLLREIKELQLQDGLRAQAMDIDEARLYLFSSMGWEDGGAR